MRTVSNFVNCKSHVRLPTKTCSSSCIGLGGSVCGEQTHHGSVYGLTRRINHLNTNLPRTPRLGIMFDLFLLRNCFCPMCLDRISSLLARLGRKLWTRLGTR